MASTLAAALGALPRGLQEGARALADQVLRRPPRPLQALAWVRAHAREGDPAGVLAALDDFGRNRRFLMNVGDEKGPLLTATLAEAVRGRPAPRVLELGCYCGYSAILMAQALPAGGRLTSVEVNPRSVEAARQIIAWAGLAERVQVIHGRSGQVLPTLEGPFDLVFLDHWKDLYTEDLQAIERHGLLRAGGVVFADNVGPLFGATRYLDYVRSSGRYDTRYERSHVEYSRVEDGVEISVFRGGAAAAPGA